MRYAASVEQHFHATRQQPIHNRFYQEHHQNPHGFYSQSSCPQSRYSQGMPHASPTPWFVPFFQASMIPFPTAPILGAFAAPSKSLSPVVLLEPSSSPSDCSICLTSSLSGLATQQNTSNNLSKSICAPPLTPWRSNPHSTKHFKQSFKIYALHHSLRDAPTLTQQNTSNNLSKSICTPPLTLPRSNPHSIKHFKQLESFKIYMHSATKPLQLYIYKPSHYANTPTVLIFCTPWGLLLSHGLSHHFTFATSSDRHLKLSSSQFLHIAFTYCKCQSELSQAQSGTGKTETFSIAILQSIDITVLDAQALVFSPTQELATQIQSAVLALGDYMNVQCHTCIGVHL